mgnify:CR=1 FL=1
MKEPMTDARRKQLYRIKKRKRRKQCIRVALRMAVLCFLVLFAVQKTADLLRVDDSDRMEDAEQSYSGQGGKTRTNTEKTWGVFGKADVLTQEAEKNTSANGKIETYPTVNGGGNANYIASLRYLFLTSIRLKKGQSYNDISYKDRYEGNYRRTKSIVDNCVNQNYQNIKNTSKINSLKIFIKF